MPNKKYRHECEECGAPATRNLQECWVEYRVKPNGDFGKADVVENHGENHFICDDCEIN